MFVPATFTQKEATWNAFTLILPAVSVGNVGQLAADLFISTLHAERIGYFYDDCILPMIGNDPYFSSGLSDFSLATSCDVYCSNEHQVVIVQQRAQFVKGKRKQFREKLLKWILQENFKMVVLLSSTYSQLRHDQQMSGSQFRFLLTPKLKLAIGDELVTKLGWSELEKETPECEDGSSPALHIPGGGITKTLYDDCEAAGLPLAVFLKFCSEGDNTSDALHLASFANTWLHLLHRQGTQQGSQTGDSWQIPRSWNLNFGSCANKQLYN